MKKKSLNSLRINKTTISNFNAVLGGGAKGSQNLAHCTGVDTAQSFCGGATCGPDCEAQTASEQTMCCD